jgi:putative acetyltransferase
MKKRSSDPSIPHVLVAPRVTSGQIQVVRARGGVDRAAVLALFCEYGSSLAVNLEYQGLTGDIADFPGEYSPPSGDLLLAKVGSEPAGCVALRAYDRSKLEMKRLYVRPFAQRRGIGRSLVEAAIATAVEGRYSELRLDTLATMVAAQSLYRSMGFTETAPYGKANLPGMRFYALTLAGR